MAPRILGSRGTPSKFVLYALKDMYAKFGTFTRLVTIFVNFDANGLDYNEESRQTVPVSKLNATFFNTCTDEASTYMFINMPSCSFSSLLNCTSPRGTNSRNRQDLQCKSCGLLELDPHGQEQFNKDEKLQVAINKHPTLWVGDWVSVKRPLGVGVSFSFFFSLFFAIKLEIDSFLVEKVSVDLHERKILLNKL